MRVRGIDSLALCLGCFACLTTACYAPVPQPGAPCANGVCPSGQVCAAATQTCELVEDVPSDASSPGDPAEPDGGGSPSCFGGGLVQFCLAVPPSAPLAITSNTTIDTDSSPLCAAYTGGPQDVPLCVIASTSVSIATDQRLRAIGSRPLVLLATGTFTVDGTIDVRAGAGANPSACGTPDAATGQQGGAGGSRQGRGGNGGAAVSGTGPSAAQGSATLAFRGGCRGAGGAGTSPGTGGSGGGAVYLIAPTLTIRGTLDASGDGGGPGTVGGGGGGGGSGGFVGLDAPTIMVAAGARIFANGGGGGEGATPKKAGTGGSRSVGPSSAASGGAGGAKHGGDGGTGSSGTAIDGGGGGAGGNCARNGASGGGGGGGSGFVYVYPARSLGGSVAPPPV